MAKIYAPNEEYTGISASVNFVKGVGETSDPYLLDWFARHGYRVAEEKKPSKTKSKNADPVKADADKGTDEAVKVDSE